MIEFYVKPMYQKFINRYLVANIAKYEAITPNKITGCALISGLFIPVAVYYHQISLAICLLVFSGMLDILDGALARYKYNITLIGCAFDIMSDRMVECAIFIALAFSQAGHNLMYLIIMICATILCLSSFFIVGILDQNISDKGFYYSPGLIERAEAFVFFAVMLIFPAIFVQVSIAYSVLTVYTAVKRLFDFIKTIN